MRHHSPPRILIVDDEPALRQLLVRALESEGYEVVAVNDGQAGYDAARTAGRPYDLVITNNYMPHMSGTELIGHLTSLFPDLPILHLDDLSRPKALPDGAPTLYKPFRLEVLSESVKRLLQGDQGEQVSSVPR
jgi:DNA-binding response OmpR family regulator